MSHALQVSVAAAEVGAATALILDGTHYSYSQLAALVQETRVESPVFVADAGLPTLLQIYACLEEGRTMCILPAGAGQEEIESVRQRVADVSPEIALVLFSSGSSGHPKGVMLTRQALIASARASASVHGWRDKERWLCCLPLHHIGGLSVLLRTLIARKTAVVAPGFEVDQVHSTLLDHKVTVVSLVPTMLWRLLDAGYRSPPSLRLVLIGGAALDKQLRESAEAAGYPIVHSYGMTETASQIVVEGRPLEGVELQIRAGQLLVRGPMLMRGYLSPDDGVPACQEGWFQTRDRARFDEDGLLIIEGRADATIISGGENIDPRQVEEALRACTGVRACLALGLPHPQWGQELLALVVINPAIARDAIGKEVQGLLSRHLRPKGLIPVDTLPMLENGKLDMRRASEIAAFWRASPW